MLQCSAGKPPLLGLSEKELALHFIGIDIAGKEHFAGIRTEDGAPRLARHGASPL